MPTGFSDPELLLSPSPDLGLGRAVQPPGAEAATENPPDGAQFSKYSIKSSKAKNKLQAPMLDLELGFTDHQSPLSGLWGAE